MIGGIRVFLVLSALQLPVSIALYAVREAGEQRQRVMYDGVPGLHAEDRGAGTIDCSGVTECRQQKAEICVIGEAHEPFGHFLPKGVKIDIIQYGAHQLTAAAGDNGVEIGAGEEIIDLFAAGVRCVADADSPCCEASEACRNHRVIGAQAYEGACGGHRESPG